MMQRLGILCGLLLLAPSAGFGQSTETGGAQKSRDLVAEGQRQESVGNRQKAMEAYTAAIAHDPNYGAAFYRRGKLHLDLGEQQQALGDCKQALALQLDIAGVHRC